METRICDLPDDLLLRILHHVPTKDALATSILSKRWRYVWTMLPTLEFIDDGSESVGWFIENSLQLHKAPKLYCLTVEVGPRCPVDLDVGNWVDNAVNRGVRGLFLKLLWNAEPTSFPKCLYTCDTLVALTLSNQILVDVSFQARLPSLLSLNLKYVVYKDEDSLVRLLSSSPVLKVLHVHRHEDDNLINFTVKVSSLKTLHYVATWRKDGKKDKVEGDEFEENDVEDDNVEEVEEDDGFDEIEEDEVDDDDVDEVDDNVDDDDDDVDEVEDDDDSNPSLVIDSPALTNLKLDYDWDYCLIENMSCLDEAKLHYVRNPSDKFLRSLSIERL
ncbi:hypothetical protein CARUB_v10010902mg [Capsella rubella]|uniref:F-box domain-containing protein n=1 Tax=Capsella rubella TaxID=81985 RepID=R0IHR7_9BRAS|nr:hypothetical protein CARUB_v10010902mg [Capsella rubella]